MVTLENVMHGPPVAVSPRMRVGDAAVVSSWKHVRHLLVHDTKRIVGIVCVCDLRSGDLRAPVSQQMKTTIVTIDKSASLHEAAAALRQHGVGCLPVMSDGTIVGVVSRGDLLRAGLESDEVVGERLCSSCHRYHDLRALGDDTDVHFCADCLERAAPAVDDDEIGPGD
ncbi:MAG: CBS domain-containing protein [Deltaproteobacteria bacterium]|nr:CBS domain-containing protein [Deltaproteobacteria bacterium]